MLRQKTAATMGRKARVFMSDTRPKSGHMRTYHQMLLGAASAHGSRSAFRRGGSRKTLGPNLVPAGTG
jgi:hypothetical protein